MPGRPRYLRGAAAYTRERAPLLASFTPATPFSTTKLARVPTEHGQCARCIVADRRQTAI
jgi:hypothetical protein